MYKRLFLPLLLLALLGCAEKNTKTAELVPQDLPYSVTLPQGWKIVPNNKVSASFKKLAEVGGQTFVSAYTGAPTAEVRLPLIVFARYNKGKLGDSEIIVLHDSAEKMFGAAGKKQDSTVLVSNKHYDEQSKRLFLDVDIANEQISLRCLVNILLSEEGYIVALGYASPSDTKAQAVIRQIIDSVVLVPELQYR